MQNKQRTILFKRIGLIILLFSSVTSCRYNKFLNNDELLLSENEIVIKDEANPIKNKSALRDGMSTILRQRPNSNLWGVGSLPRYKLWRYNLRHSYYDSLPRHENIRERKVEPPTIVNKASVRLTDTSIKRYMLNNGYFYSRVSDTVIEKKNQEAKVIYTVVPGKQYFINKVQHNIESPSIRSLIQQTARKSHIKKGKVFRNIDLGLERERVYNLLRNSGYYAFKIENMNFEPDTINRSELRDIISDPFASITKVVAPSTQDSIDVYMNLYPTRDSAFDKRFTLDRVYVKYKDPFHDHDEIKLQEEQYKDLIFQYYDLIIKRDIIYENIFIHPKQLYSTKNLESTYSRLNQLGTFQLVQIRFVRNKDGKNTLDCYIELTMAKKRDIKLNADISNGEDYFAGFGGGLNYNTKNLFRGANKLNLQAQYTVEYRQRNQDRLADGFLLNANNFNASANFTLPKFLLPFNWKTSRNNTPFTIFSLAHSRINRVGSFKLQNTTAKLSYSWKETNKKSWFVSPMFLSFTSVPEDRLSAEFVSRIAGSRYLQNTYSNNFIQGENFNFEYRSTQNNQAPKLHTFNIGFEEAGLLLQGVNVLNKAITNKSISPIAHYVRADLDYRFYRNRNKVQWASRAMVGIGIPTFGDISLPYIKQYSQGGAFSNRGWQLRNLGPGRTLPEDPNGRQIIDRTGDIKLELNTELRFPVAKIGIFELKGATFVDGGNIWLFQEDSTNIGGEIQLDQLWQDIAISSGIGLRLDFSFFVFRVDHAWRLKYPYILTNSGWDFNGLRLNDGQWNVAIGYPF